MASYGENNNSEDYRPDDYPDTDFCPQQLRSESSGASSYLDQVRTSVEYTTRV